MRTKRAGQSALLLLGAVEILQREKIDYAVIGAFALSAHGVVRVSTDVDVRCTWPGRGAQFQRTGFGTELRRGEADDPIHAMLILSDSHNNHVDLLGGLRGMDPAILSRTVEVPFIGMNLRIAGCEDFIAMRCFAGGPQDILDARSAYRSTQSPVDLAIACHPQVLLTVLQHLGKDDHILLVLRTIGGELRAQDVLEACGAQFDAKGPIGNR